MNTTIKLHRLFSNGMVLQRNATINICGTATADSAISVTFRGNTYETRANGAGEWETDFVTGDAGGPDTLTVRAHNGSTVTDELTVRDVYTGEVWVCSGQSNMQLPMERLAFAYPEEMAREANEHVRVFTVPIRAYFEGEKRDLESGEWVCAEPKTMGGISGTSYFFAKHLARSLGVPVGIINASQGGSPIASWMNRDSLTKAHPTDFVPRDDVQTEKIWNQQIEGNALIDVWQKSAADKDIGLREKWYKTGFAAADGANTVTLKNDSAADTDATCGASKNSVCAATCGEGVVPYTVPSLFPPLPNGKAGTYWIQKTVTLSAKEAAICNKTETYVWFGVIIDADRMWINGTEIGSTPYMYPPRRYTVPAGVLREGENLITLQVLCTGGNGGAECVADKPYALFTANLLTKDWHDVAAAHGCSCESSADAASTASAAGAGSCCCGNTDSRHVTADSVWIDLRGEWLLKKGCELKKMPPQFFPEWQPTALYNGMLSPLFNYTVRGAAWYQGESNTHYSHEYGTLLTEMIALWRQKFTRAAGASKDSPMPFLVAQLPNFGKPTPCEPNAAWAALRAEQSAVAQKDPRVGLAVLIDAGERNDLHPEDKQTVGARLASEALRIAYGFDAASVSPRAERFAQNADTVDITFTLAKNESLVWVREEAARVDGVPGNKDVIPANGTGTGADSSTGTAQKKDAPSTTCTACSEKDECAKSAVKEAEQSGFCAVYTSADSPNTERIVPVCAKITGAQTVRILLPTNIGGTCKKLCYLWSDSPSRVTLYSSSLLPAEPFMLNLTQ